MFLGTYDSVTLSAFGSVQEVSCVPCRLSVITSTASVCPVLLPLSSRLKFITFSKDSKKHNLKGGVSQHPVRGTSSIKAYCLGAGQIPYQYSTCHKSTRWGRAQSPAPCYSDGHTAIPAGLDRLVSLSFNERPCLKERHPMSISGLHTHTPTHDLLKDCLIFFPDMALCCHCVFLGGHKFGDICKDILCLSTFNSHWFFFLFFFSLSVPET